jgi:hypothetical protein
MMNFLVDKEGYYGEFGGAYEKHYEIALRLVMKIVS